MATCEHMRGSFGHALDRLRLLWISIVAIRYHKMDASNWILKRKLNANLERLSFGHEAPLARFFWDDHAQFASVNIGIHIIALLEM